MQPKGAVLLVLSATKIAPTLAEKVILTYNGKTINADKYKQLNGKVNAKFNRAKLQELLSGAEEMAEVRIGVKAGEEWLMGVDQLLITGN